MRDPLYLVVYLIHFPCVSNRYFSHVRVLTHSYIRTGIGFLLVYLVKFVEMCEISECLRQTSKVILVIVNLLFLVSWISITRNLQFTLQCKL